jgi:hypothetical protein
MTAYALEYPVGASPTAAPTPDVTIVAPLGSFGYLMSDGTTTSTPSAEALAAYNAKYHAEHPETWSISELPAETALALSMRIDSLPKNINGWRDGGRDAYDWLNSIGYKQAAIELYSKVFGISAPIRKEDIGKGSPSLSIIASSAGYDSASTGAMSSKRPPWLGGGRPKTSGA